ncbi:MAG TPA: class I SAM-dependent methyltransferase [Actinopolymorphaceae bacterium]|jgi:SAM-dependent methyltransferase
METSPRPHPRPFATTAPSYSRGRPDYPAEMIRWALPTTSNVVDLAAGAGALTRGLLEQGHRVMAVEPVGQMLTELLRACPQALGIRGAAEAIPLRSGSADAVTVGQAFHWFDPVRALPEIARILRPGGTLVVAYNVMDFSVPWVRRFSDLIGGGRHELPAQLAAIDASEAFDEPRRKVFRHWQSLDRVGLVDLVSSYSFVAAQSEDQRAALAADVAAFFTSTAPGSTLRLPYRTHGLTAVVSKAADYQRVQG